MKQWDSCHLNERSHHTQFSLLASEIFWRAASKTSFLFESQLKSICLLILRAKERQQGAEATHSWHIKSSQYLHKYSLLTKSVSCSSQWDFHHHVFIRSSTSLNSKCSWFTYPRTIQAHGSLHNKWVCLRGILSSQNRKDFLNLK